MKGEPYSILKLSYAERARTSVPGMQRRELRDYVLQNYVLAVSRVDARMVTDQLGFALLAMVRCDPSSWDYCVLDVVVSLATGVPTYPTSNDSSIFFAYVKTLDVDQFLGVIRFSLGLMMVAKSASLSTEKYVLTICDTQC